MTQLATDILAELIERKHRCLVQLRDAGRRQLELIEAGEMTALLDLLATKQGMLLALRKVERAMDPFRDQDPQARRWRSPEHRARCGEMLRECETLLGDIVTCEKYCEAALQQRRDATAVQLQGVQHAGRACGAYAHREQPAGQLDLTSER